MKEKTYTNEHGDEFFVEEMTRKEFIEWAVGTIEAINEFGSEDDRIYVEYKDGSVYDNLGGYGESGKFSKTGIAWGYIDNGSTYQIYGAYELDENMIPQAA